MKHLTIKNFFRNPFSIFKQRNITFDLLKFFAAMLVILDHSLQRWISGSQNTQLYNFIFVTQMPLFMFISGFFVTSKASRIQSFRDFALAIGELAALLLIPFLSFSLIKSAIITNSFYDYLINLRNCFLEPQISLWFLWVLFFLELFLLLSFTLCKLFKIKKDWLTYLISLVLFLSFDAVIFVLYWKATSYFDFKLIVYYSLFFLVGFSLSYFKNTKLLLIRSKWWIKLLFATLSLSLLVCCMILRPTMIFDDETALNILIRIAASGSSIILCYIVFYFISKLKILKYLSCLGTLSLETYYVHLLLFLIPVLNEKLSYSSPAIGFIFIGLYLLVILVTYTVVFAIKAVIPLDVVLFGKIKQARQSAKSCTN